MGSSAEYTLNERIYRLYIPDGIGANAPLVVCNHPGLSNATRWETFVTALNNTLDQAADTGLFYVAYPAGTEFPVGSGKRTWDAGWCCGYALQLRQNDIGYLKLLITQLQLDYSINPAKIFMSGYSNGAMLSYSYICTHPSDIAGMAVAAGALVLDNDFAVNPINVHLTHIYGTADTNVPPAGGFGADGKYYPPLAQTIAFMESRGCTATVIELDGAAHDFASIQSVLASQEGTSFAQIIANMVSA